MPAPQFVSLAHMNVPSILLVSFVSMWAGNHYTPLPKSGATIGENASSRPLDEVFSRIVKFIVRLKLKWYISYLSCLPAKKAGALKEGLFDACFICGDSIFLYTGSNSIDVQKYFISGKFCYRHFSWRSKTGEWLHYNQLKIKGCIR